MTSNRRCGRDSDVRGGRWYFREGSVYLLFGVTWSVLYDTIYQLQPTAFSLNSTASALVAPGHPIFSVCDVEDGVTKVAIHGDDLLLTPRNVPHSKVVRTRISKPDFGATPVVIPESPAVINSMAAAGGAPCVEKFAGGLGPLLRFRYDSRTPETIKLLFDGTVSLGGQVVTASPVSDPRMSGVLLRDGELVAEINCYRYL